MSFRIGIVGTGSGIRTHLLGMQSVKRAEPVGVVGTSVPRAQRLLASYGLSIKLACEWEALLDLKPDLICITVPPSARKEYYNSLSGFQGALLIEKPFITRLEDAATIMEALEAYQDRAFIDFQLRGLPLFCQLRQDIQQGLYGTIYSVSLYERTSSYRCDKLPNWMESRESGGGQAFSMGTHLLDLALFLLGKKYGSIDSSTVSGQCSSPNLQWAGQDVLYPIDEYFQLNMDVGGTLVHLASSAVSIADRTLEFILEGTTGTIEFCYRNGVGKLSVWTVASGKTQSFVDAEGSLSSEPTNGLGSSLFRLSYPGYIKTIIKSIEDSEDPDYKLASLKDGLDNTRIIVQSINSRYGRHDY